MGWPPRQSPQKPIAEQLSAGATLIVRAKPKEDESYLGFLLRLAEINFYDTPDWLYNLVDYSSAPFRMCAATADARVSLRLAALTKLDIKDLGSLFNHPIADKYGVSFFGQIIQPYLLRQRRPRVCPECLNESEYYRKQWDFSPLASCPLHHAILVEECPGCREPITWLRNSVTHCSCGTDWRQSQTTRINESESVVSYLIYRAFGLTSAQAHNPNSDNLLYNADLLALVSALLVITNEREGHSDSNGKHIFPAGSCLEVHRWMLDAFIVFDNWPINFHRFLDSVASVAKSQKSSTSLRTVFGSFHRRLYGPGCLPAPIGDVVREQFENYVLEHLDQGFVCSQWFKFKCKGKYVSRAQASTMLKMDAPVLDGLISAGRLKGLVRRNSTGRRIFLVEAASVERLKLERDRYLPLMAASKLLGISQLNVLRLVENSLLNAARGSSIDNSENWGFEETTICDFLATVFSRTVEFTSRGRNDLREFNDVLNTLTIALSTSGWGVQTMVKDILDGVLTPEREPTISTGLGGLLFGRREISDYIKTKLGAKSDNLRLAAGADTLGFKAKSLHYLARKGLIETKSQTKQGARDEIITSEAVRRFDSKYVAAGKVARVVGTRPGWLLQALKAQNVYAVSGKSVDGGPQYFLRRSDLPSLKRKDLVIAFPMLREKKRKRTSKVDSVGAAKILSVKTEVIPGLIKNGILHHYAESETAQGKHIFNRTYIERFKGQFRDISDVLALGAAAKLLKTPPNRIYGQWIKPGYLKYEISRDGKKRYLRKSKVEKILFFKESVVNCAEAAALLCTPYWRVKTLILNGVLNPVTNPYPEALRHLFYSKAQVKKLRGKKIILVRRKRPSVKSST